jgi:hypothetical protein
LLFFFISDITIIINILFLVDATSESFAVFITVAAAVADTPTVNASEANLLSKSSKSPKSLKSPKGVIETIAGTGMFGYSRDGGPAVSARFNTPQGVFVDETGRVFIAYSENNIVRMVDTNGIITTIAGMPETPGYSGDNVAAGARSVRDTEL